MCGIVGKINFDSEPVDPAQIGRMADAVRHRGPDDEGVWTGDGVGLGHRRLSIIDLSSSGRNPMCNEDATVWIVFNGEIYNFQELRPGLEARGHRFKSHTDTEVILHLYEDLGPACVEKLRGMFAFAIWDRREQRLLLARDRLGVKPLFYAADARSLWFGSEVKAILASGEVRAEPDSIAIDQFLLWQCIPSPRTGFEEVRKLPPASILICQRDKPLHIRKYWELDCSPAPFRREAEAIGNVWELVQDATRMRLVADVPVGIFLSGGIDSACVLAAARQKHSGKIQTFSVTFEHQSFDESHNARALARHFETDHYEFKVTARAMEALPKMAELFDEPFADLASIPTYYLARLSREHVKVALSGDGGDEAFGGYQRYLALKALRWLSHIPGSHWLGKLSALIPYRAGERSRFRYARELLAIADRQPDQQYRSILLGMLNEDQWRAAYCDGFREKLAGEGTRGPEDLMSGWHKVNAADDLARAMANDTLCYIAECLNPKVDVCSMACGLEVRSPFLDHQLVETCARLPTSLKIRRSQQKYILRRAFRHLLPKEILHCPKRGFGMPIASWLRHELKDYARDSLLSPHSPVTEIVKLAYLREMLAEHAAGKRNWHIQLWRLLVLDEWLRRGVQAQGSAVGQEAALRM